MRIFLIDFENTKSNGITGIDLLDKDDIVYLFYSNNVDSITLEAHMNIVSSKAEFQPIKLDKPGKNALDFQLVTYLGYLIGTKHEGEYYIVSRDYGFQHSVNFCTKYLSNESVLVKRVESIEAVVAPKKPVKEEVAVASISDQESVSNTLPKAIVKDNIVVPEKIVKIEDSANTILKDITQNNEHIEEELEEVRKIIVSIYDSTQFEKFGERSVRLFQKADTKQGFYRSMTKAFGASIGRELYTMLKKEYDHYKSVEEAIIS